jgi:hypothetical protein
VDDKSSRKLLFSNTLSKVRSVDPEGRFIPAVFLHNSKDKVRLLEFERASVHKRKKTVVSRRIVRLL